MALIANQRGAEAAQAQMLEFVSADPKTQSIQREQIAIGRIDKLIQIPIEREDRAIQTS